MRGIKMASLGLILFGVLGGCSRSEPRLNEPPKAIPECDAYVQAYGTCLASMGADGDDPRVASLRASLADVPTDEAARERKRAECAANRDNITSHCR